VRRSRGKITHCRAARGTATTRFSATPHLPVRVDVLLAKRSAGIADLGALWADVREMWRPTRHEIGAQRAHLRAVQQSDQVLRFGVVTAAMKKMGNRPGADPVALQAVADALLH